MDESLLKSMKIPTIQILGSDQEAEDYLASFRLPVSVMSSHNSNASFGRDKSNSMIDVHAPVDYHVATKGNSDMVTPGGETRAKALSQQEGFVERLIGSGKLELIGTGHTDFFAMLQLHFKLKWSDARRAEFKGRPVAVETTTLTIGHTLELDKGQQKKTVNQYTIMGKLGQGSYGIVHLALDKKTNDLVAIKEISKQSLQQLGKFASLHYQSSTRYDEVIKDVKLLKYIKYHRNVINLLEIINDPKSDMLYLITEYAVKGTLMEWNDVLGSYVCEWYSRTESGGIHEEYARLIMKDVVTGLQYLHDKRIVHRDIKPDNFLMDGGATTKIADFDTGHVFAEGDSPQLTSSVGTFMFMSPLAIAGEAHNAYATDVWACGITLWCLLMGTPPFVAEGHLELFDLIESGEYKFPPEAADLSDDVKSLLQKLLLKDENERIKTSEILLEDWFQQPLARGKSSFPLYEQ